MISPRCSVALAVSLLVMACGDRATAPTPSNAVVVSLASVRTDVGAIVLTIVGPDVASIESASSAFQVYGGFASAGETRVVLLGDIAPGALFTLKLRSPHTANDYAVRVQQVATRVGALATDSSAYQVTLHAPGM
jgi:hypothetical protein